MANMCSLCPSSLALKHHLARHLKSVHITLSERKHVCQTCKRSFQRSDTLLRHERTHHIEQKTYKCNECDKKYKRRDALTRHTKASHLDEKRCHRERKRTSSSFRDTYVEPYSTHSNEGDPPSSKRQRTTSLRSESENIEDDEYIEMDMDGGQNQLATSPTTDVHQCHTASEERDPTGDPAEDHPEGQDLNSLYKKHHMEIRTYLQTNGMLKDLYNFKLEKMATDKLVEAADYVFKKQVTAFKVNVSFGFLLRNIGTCQAQYYNSLQSNHFFQEPILVTDGKSFANFVSLLMAKDPIRHVSEVRPTSKWVVDVITNATFHVYKLLDHPIGGAPQLPNYIQYNKAIVSLAKSPQTGSPYKDNLCFFRCLALHRGAHVKALETKTRLLYSQVFAGKQDTFEGVPLSKLDEMETQFKLNIVVYEKISVAEDNVTEDGTDNCTGSNVRVSPVVARLVRRSSQHYDDTIYLNLFGNHFSYIKDIKRYTKSYQCQKCQKLWQQHAMLNRHTATCKGTGVEHKFPGGVYTHPKTVFELLEKEGIIIPKNLRYYPYRAVFDFESFFESVPTEPSGGSKITWEAKHIPLSVSVCSNVPTYEDPRCFVSNGDKKKLVVRLLKYLTAMSKRSKAILQHVYAPYIQEIKKRITKDEKAFKALCQANKKHGRPRQHYLKTLLDNLDDYLAELPVIGFNSGSYDINLIKDQFFPWLVQNDQLKCLVKKCNAYMQVKCENLLFLDITNFIAPGFNYATFLKAYKCTQQKGFFPYEWIDLQKLDNKELPPHAAFYSDLNKSNISAEEYAYCQRMWQEKGMSTVRDFLIWYNNLDVVPFLEALEKMFAFYKDRCIDMFKDGISVPGLTLKYLFQMAKNEPFALIKREDKDLYYTFRDNMVGGPSIIFNRYQEKGKTKIRSTDNICQKIIGFDANALYLWAITQDMPTGPYMRRREETGFRKAKSRPVSIEWLEWKAHEGGIHIQHKWNGREKRVGLRRIPVDGFCQETNTVYQFHGCYWHAHDCDLTSKRRIKDEKAKKAYLERRRNTEEIKAYIRSLGFEYEEIWECQYDKLKKSSKLINDFLRSIGFPLERASKLKPETILRAIRKGNLYGVIECDIHVPDELKPRFAEMCPIFKNTEISVDDIGEHMKHFATSNNILSRPRRSLIGSMFGEKILLATPLVKWYLEKGLKISRIYQVIEFLPKACFKTFGEAVSDARREGDKNPSKAMIADTMKLIGNSSYGKTITNKERHRNNKFVTKMKASKLINETTFRDMEKVSKSCCEVQLAKRSITMDLPMQIGFFVYQYAKLRMLQFYYDFMDKYFDREHWEYVEMDTDSAYIAMDAEKLEDMLKPDMEDDYHENKHFWLPRTDTPEHKAYDKRTPGLFKVEWEGDGIVALNSKMYYCFGGPNKDKFSCKGISKKRNDIRKETYLDVLRTRMPQTGRNKGFRVRDNQVFTYSQVKEGFTYFYPKRKVLENGVQTTFLDI